MFQRIQQYPLIESGGRVYRPRAYGQLQPEGTWGGWIVFFLMDGSRAVSSDRETTQPTYASLISWASGLTSVYLAGALDRALRLATVPTILDDLDQAEYAALEDAETLEIGARIERAKATVDETAADLARQDAEQIRRARLATEDALAAHGGTKKK